MVGDARAEAKVGHLDAGATGEQDVLCLQVSVDDVVFVLQKQKYGINV